MSTAKRYGAMEPTFVARVPTRLSPRFSFITIETPDDLHDKSKRRAIRQHAKKDVDRSKARRFRARFAADDSGGEGDPRGTSNPDVCSAVGGAERDFMAETRPQVEDARYENFGSSEPRDQEANLISIDALRPLGAGRGFVPFKSYPVRPTPRMIQLFDYMLENEKLYRRPVRMLWVSLAMSDRDSFNISMAHAANLMFQTLGQQYCETQESLTYYTKAVQAISKRLSDGADSTSEGVIGTILGFACLDITYGKWDRWKAHMRGVRRIIDLRGGVGTLKHSYDLHMTAFWNDITGSLALDSPPGLPLPDFAATRHRAADLGRIDAFAPGFQHSHDASRLGQILCDLGELADRVQQRGLSDEQPQQELFVALQINPLVHDLLSLPRLEQDDKADEVATASSIREMLRLSALIFIGFLRQKNGILLTGLERNAQRLTELLTERAIEWSPYFNLRLWVLTMSALAAPNDRVGTVVQIASTMAYLGLNEWSETVSRLKRFIWLSWMLDDAAATLGTEVEAFRNLLL